MASQLDTSPTPNKKRLPHTPMNFPLLSKSIANFYKRKLRKHGYKCNLLSSKTLNLHGLLTVIKTKIKVEQTNLL